jgi:RsiW-degrading membrane proteinase PrsW (M82 family)
MMLLAEAALSGKVPLMVWAALVLPMIPGVIWLWIFYRTDWYEPEPKRLVAGTFALGVIAILPAFGAERLVGLFYPFLEHIERANAEGTVAWGPLVIGCFLVIGPFEELAKFAAVRWFVFRNREFDEPLDGIIYAAAAALGFASLENVLYVFDFKSGAIQWSTLGVRSLLALPGHVIFSTTWGYALGRSKFDARYRVWPMVAASAMLHGLYDFLLMCSPTRRLILLYMSLMVPVIVRQISILRSESPFAPGAVTPRLAEAPPPADASAAARGEDAT